MATVYKNTDFAGISHVFDQLSATGATDAVSTEGSNDHTFHYTVANVGTDVTVAAEGSIDGDNWFELTSETQSSDATYQITVTATPLPFVRFNLKTINGGSPTVDASYMGLRV